MLKACEPARAEPRKRQMKKLCGNCTAVRLTGDPGLAAALQVELTAVGDEPVPVSGCALSRKGINAFPEFAEGFGLDTSAMLAGLPPERYQFRAVMLLAQAGRLTYGDGKSEFRLRPGRKAPFLLPVPFQGMEYFLSAPPEDLFFTVSSLSDPALSLPVEGILDTLQGILRRCPQDATTFNTRVDVIVPMSAPPSDDTLGKVGTRNSRPIRPMPNS